MHCQLCGWTGPGPIGPCPRCGTRLVPDLGGPAGSIPSVDHTIPASYVDPTAYPGSGGWSAGYDPGTAPTMLGRPPVAGENVGRGSDGSWYVAAPPPPPRSSSRVLIAVVAGILALVGIVGAWFAFKPAATTGPAVPATTSAGTTHSAAPSRTSGSAVPQSRTPSATPTLSAPTPSASETPVTSAVTPKPNPTNVAVVRTSTGQACAENGGASGYPGYPGAVCTFWQPSAGLTTWRTVAKGSRLIACQADLGVPNPAYAANQANTWWLWAQADDGTWDWFPETAIAQGDSGRPVNGVAQCMA